MVDGSTSSVALGGTVGDIGEHSSLALDNNDNPVISYHNNGSIDDLVLVHCGNPTCSANNVYTTIDSTGNVGQDTSLALNASGHPVISYYDVTSNDLQLVRCGNANCSANNVITTVDATSSSIGLATSLALGPNSNPVISYSDNANKRLRLVRCGDPTCSANNVFTNLELFVPTTLSQVYSSVAVGGNDTVYVSFTNGNSTTNGVLKLARIIDDSSAPTANPSQAPAANLAGWNNSNVTVTWHWSDNAGGSGIDSANCQTSSTASNEGALTLTTACQDLVGNSNSATYGVQIDKTKPLVAVTGVTNGASYLLGAVPVAGCNTTDTLSGVATAATVTLSGGNGDGTGDFTARCAGGN